MGIQMEVLSLYFIKCLVFKRKILTNVLSSWIGQIFVPLITDALL